MAKPAALQYIENKTFQKLVAIILVSVILYVAYKRVKSFVQVQNADVNNGNLVEEKSYYKDLATRIYNGFKGANWGVSSREALLNELLILNDDELKATYNHFNKVSSKDGEGTLRQWIVDEFLPFSDIKAAVLDRMSTLNLV